MCWRTVTHIGNQRTIHFDACTSLGPLQIADVTLNTLNCVVVSRAILHGLDVCMRHNIIQILNKVMWG